MGKNTQQTVGGHYVEVYNERTNAEVLYGPYATADAARRGRFFSFDQATFNANQRRSLNLLFSFGTYDANEIASLLADPGACGYSRVTVKPASALKADKYWATTGVAADYPAGLDGHATFADFFFHQLFTANYSREPVLS